MTRRGAAPTNTSMGDSLVREYIDNTRALLETNPALFGMMVERQVQVRLLPKLTGPRATLEPDLWELLIFCLDGAQADVPAIDDELFEEAQGAAENGAALRGDGQAAYPQAAKAVVATLGVLREAGVYPPPRR